MLATEWFRRRRLTDSLTVYDEPFVDPMFCANIYHLKGRDRDLVVDTGMGLARLSEALDLEPGKPVVAVATHIHVDHVGSLHEFDDRRGPDWSARSFETMDDGKTYADQFRALERPVIEEPFAGWNAASWRLTPARLTARLFEGDVIDLGNRQFRVLHLPGHSPDSIGLLDEADGTFFSGDAIYDDLLFDDLPDSDPAAYRETMGRIMELPVSVVYGGHGDPFDAERMERIARDYIWKDR
jgi:glyoxylase-like metal-dependent hydrolase (beta-lactamase superfamily II)